MMMQQAQRPAAEGAKVRDGFTPQTVVAEFADMRSARAAVEALGKAGVEGDNISVTGPAADRAAEPPTEQELREKTREIDSQMAKYMLSTIGVWTVGGIIAGALLGIPLSIGIMALLGADVTLERVAVGVFLTALGAGIIAWLIPHTSYGPQAAPPWELTFAESESGRVRVGVHSEKAEDIALAEDLLRKQQPLRQYRAGPDGRHVS
jgi:hypothetical protein